MTVGLSSPPQTFDPADQHDPATQMVLRNLYDGLVAAAPDGRLVPELAESFTQPDSLTWEFHLRPGITFHNGDPLSAADVRFTFERIIHPGGILIPEVHDSPWRETFAPLERIEVVDDLTIRFHLSRPWPSGLQWLAYQGILPEKYYTQTGPQGFLESPVGSGPFRFVSRSEAGVVMLARYPGYYGGAADMPPVGPALLDAVVFRPIPDDAARVTALQTGEVQVVQAIPAPLVSQLTGEMDWASKPVSACGGFYAWEPTPQPSGLVVLPVPRPRPLWLAFNLRRPPWNDLRVRQALNLAVRRDYLIEYAAYGRGVPMTGPLSPFNHFADLDLPAFEYDPAGAQALFSEAGVDPAVLDMTIEARSGDAAPAEGLARQLRVLGMTVHVRVWEDEAALARALQGGDWDAALQSVPDPGIDAYEPLARFWRITGLENFSGYDNPQVDALLNQAATVRDESRRHTLYNQLQTLVRADLPALFLYVPLQAEACASGVHNWTPSPYGLIGLHDVWRGDR
ncbi:MAG: ABC transporter substrate-binding protein [Anaerolineales bacterium]